MKHLIGKIEAVNKANNYAMKLYPQLTEFFRPYVGSVIVKKDGTLLAKIQSKMPELPNTNPLSVHRHYTNYSLAWTIKTCVSVPTDCDYSIAVYHEVTIYIGDLDNQVLTKLCESYQDPINLRDNYTLDEVVKNREAANKAKQAYYDAQDKCYPFGEG